MRLTKRRADPHPAPPRHATPIRHPHSATRPEADHSCALTTPPPYEAKAVAPPPSFGRYAAAPCSWPPLMEMVGAEPPLVEQPGPRNRRARRWGIARIGSRDGTLT